MTGAGQEQPPIRTAKDAARDLIYRYVARGDPLQSLVDGAMGRWGPGYRAQIGGYVCLNDYADDFRCTKAMKKLTAHQIAAQPHGFAPQFSLDKIYDEIARELRGEPVQRDLL